LPFENASNWCEQKGMRLVVVETIKELEALFAQTGQNSSEFNNECNFGILFSEMRD